MHPVPILAILFVVICAVTCQGSNPTIPCDSTSGCIAQVTCSAGTHWAPNVNLGGCCPGCVTGLGFQELGCDETNQCAPGLFCGRGGTCLIDNTTCLATKHAPAKVPWKPSCDSEGNFLPKQCRGDLVHGRCFCYSFTGKRIFGTEWRGKATEMTCACSRLRSDLEAQGRSDVTLHCSSDGNFEPLQCDSDMCWCVDPQTGYPWPKVPVVLPSMWRKLPCYNHTLHGDQYLRQCESASFAQYRVQHKYALHGHTNVSLTRVACDYDGSYGMYEIERGIAYCTWRDGERMKQFQTSSLKLREMTCNCARDQKIYEADGLTLELLCEGSGNYATVQDTNGERFCVDRDGFVVAYGIESVEECNEYIWSSY